MICRDTSLFCVVADDGCDLLCGESFHTPEGSITVSVEALLLYSLDEFRFALMVETYYEGSEKTT